MRGHTDEGNYSWKGREKEQSIEPKENRATDAFMTTNREKDEKCAVQTQPVKN